MYTIPSIDMAATGNRILRLREAAGLTVRELQEIFGFATPQAIYKWQHGAAMPTIDNLVMLAAVFGVTLDDIIVVKTNAVTLSEPAYCKNTQAQPFSSKNAIPILRF